MSIEKGIRYNVETDEQEEYEYEVDDALRAKEQRIFEIRNRMTEIVQLLEKDSYKNNKYQEGALTEEEWQIHIATRKSLRAEYNTIQTELATLTDVTV